MRKLVLPAVTALLLLASPVFAKDGLYVGAYALPRIKVSGVSGVESGSGYGFRAGFGFNRYFSLEASYDISEQDMTNTLKADLRGWAADAKINFPLTSLEQGDVISLEPYIRGGYGDYELKIPGSGSPSGNGNRFGGGVELYLFRELSISAGWTRTKVSLDSLIVRTKARIKAIDVGLSYHFL